ncbi:MAG: carboxypeptidase-like regulatory domain-containing protein [Chitinophagaceae bacterium]
MNKLFIMSLAVMVVLVNSSFNNKPAYAGTIIQGTVLSEKTGKPVPGAIVSVVSGEEEALTKQKGEFRIQTAKNTPFVLTTEHGDYETSRITITDAGQRIIIRLKPKQK